MAGYRLSAGRGRYAPAVLALIGMLGVALALYLFDTNVKNIKTDRDVIGVVFSVVAVVTLLLALIWSGIRVHRIENTLYEVMVETAKATSLVFIILLGAAMLTAAFRAFGGEELVRDYLNSLPGGFWTKFIIVMAVIFVLGFFLDFIEIAVVVVPIVAPILLADPSANITAVWLGVMIGLNIQTSFLTPPFGFALFYLRGVAPAVVKTINMYKGVIAFILLQLVALAIVGYFPALVNYLPNRVSLLSETAPPPRNPKLQYCIEEYISERFSKDNAVLMTAINDARSLDYTMLPKKLAQSVTDSFDHAESALELLQRAQRAEEEVLAGSKPYRPLHTVVRDIEAEVRDLQTIIDELTTVRERVRGDTVTERRERLAQRIEALKAEQAQALAGIPPEWESAHATYTTLLNAEVTARNDYRRAADKGYAAIADLQATLAATDAFLVLERKLPELKQQVLDNEPADMVDVVKALADEFGDIEGASEVKSALSKARSALRAKSPDQQKALSDKSTRPLQRLPNRSNGVSWRMKNSRTRLPFMKKCCGRQSVFVNRYAYRNLRLCMLPPAAHITGMSR